MNTQQTIVTLRSDAPAALALGPKHGLSESYSFLSTREVVEALGADGWVVTQARQTPTRIDDNRHFAKHELIFADRDVLTSGQYLGWCEETPRIILTNSHDGGAKFKLQAGLFRSYCFNGVVVSDGLVQSVGIRHHRHTTQEVVAAAQSFRANAEKILEHVETFRARELTHAKAVEFARRAIQLRHAEDPKALVTMDDILKAQRREDIGTDLWRTFNRVQEWLLKGSYPIFFQSPTGQWTHRAARPVKALDVANRLNTGLWDLAELFSRN